MKEKLKVKVWNYKNVVLFEVLEQSDNLRGKDLLFTASNDLAIFSNDYVDFNKFQIYIRGNERGTDKDVASGEFSSIEEAKQFVEKVKQAVKEFNEALSPILTDEEKAYLKAVIEPFRNEVEWIGKYRGICEGNSKEYILIKMEKTINNIALPFFKRNAMYKGMKIDKEYTLEELGL